MLSLLLHIRVLEARGVSPRAGNVLVFPHGGTMGSLVHEGSAVTKGVKYVVRTDVLYGLPGQKKRVRGLATWPSPMASSATLGK